MDLLKAENALVNAIMFPGALVKSSYNCDTFKESFNLQMIYVPFTPRCCNAFSYLLAAPTHIPVLLCSNHNVKSSGMAIHFHGNACDIGQIAVCAQREAQAFRCHYMLVEYPGYGISNGYPNETVIDEVAMTVFQFVVNTLSIPAADIILTGRSIGTGPVCRLASAVQTQLDMTVRAVILQSPFASIRDATSDLLGIASCFMFNRWENWMYLVGSSQDASVIRAPVLFIHADGDAIIPIRHSRYLHKQRLEQGLSSELFIQKSNAKYIKGHNFFDYERDVVLPSREFLLKHSDVNGGSEKVRLSSQIVQQYSVIPKIYQQRHEYVQQYVQVQREKQAQKESLLTASQKKGKDSAASGDVPLQPSRFTLPVVSALCCCPCVFCCEAQLACTVHSLRACVEWSCGLVPVFDYHRMKQAEQAEELRLHPELQEKKSGLWAMWRRQKEIPVEHLLDQRKTEVQNPLVENSVASGTERRRKSNRGAQASSPEDSPKIVEDADFTYIPG